jgi:hypothetical protein
MEPGSTLFRRTPRLLSRCAAVLLAASASPAQADPFPMSAGTALRPLKEPPVAIAKEDLAIQVTLEEMRVAAQLDLHNRSDKPAQFDVGFPCNPQRQEGIVGLSCAIKPAIKVGGKPVRTTLQKAPGTSQWVWAMRFRPDEQVHLEVSYAVPIKNSRYQTPFFGANAFYYQLTTGARWAGPIGALNIEVTLPVETIVQISPKGYTRTAGKISWSLKDHLPAEDVIIRVDPLDTMRFLDLHHARSSSALHSARQARTFDARGLHVLAEKWRSSVDKLAERYKKYLSFSDAPEATAAPPEEVRRCILDSARLIDEAAGPPPAAAPAPAAPSPGAPAPASPHPPAPPAGSRGTTG